MSLAERAYNANSKALLRLNDNERIREFLPKLDNLMNNHPEMTWPGYFYGKLLLSLGSTPEEELRVILPFARKKATEFWVWQLLSDVFVNDNEKRLACLLRAVHCDTQEQFLIKVRIKLARLFILQGQYNLAKYHSKNIHWLQHCSNIAVHCRQAAICSSIYIRIFDGKALFDNKKGLTRIVSL